MELTAGIRLVPTVYIVRGEQGLLHRAVLALTDAAAGRAVFTAALDGDTRETELTLTGGACEATVEIPCRETAQTLCWRLTEADGKCRSGEVLWQPQRRWEVHFVPVTHHDLGYTEPVEPLLTTYCGYYDRILDFLDRTAAYPPEAQYRYTVEELWSLEEYLRRAPKDKREKLIGYVREGRVEISALYANVIDGICDEEELIRLLYPAETLREAYALPVTTASLVDMPGLSGGVIRALGSAGIRYLFIGFPKYFEWGDTKGERLPMQHGFWDEKALLPNGRPLAFRWRGPDGSEVLCWYQAGYGWFGDDAIPCLETDTFDVVEKHLPTFLRDLEKRGCPYSVMRYIDHGSDNQIPQCVIADIVREWNRRYAYPRLKVSTNAAFFRALEAQCGDAPTLCGELPQTDYTVLSLTQAEQTAQNAENRTALRQTETLAAVLAAELGEKVPPDDFDAVWRDILLYDEHCFGMGIPLGAPHAYSWSAKQHYMRRAAYAVERQQRALFQKRTDALAAKPGQYLTVAYPSPQPQPHTVRVFGEDLPEHFLLEDPVSGARLPVQTDIADAPDLPWPDAGTRYAFGVMGGALAAHSRRHLLRLPPFAAVGFRTYRVVLAPLPPKKRERVSNVLENDRVRVTVDEARGCIAGIFDKQSGRELVDADSLYGFGALLCRDIATDKTDTWQHVRLSGGSAGELADSLVLRGSLAGCPEVTEEITLYKDSADVEIAIRFLKDSTPFQEVFAAFPFAGNAESFLYRSTAGIAQAFCGQLPGSNTHQYATQGFAQIRTADGTVTVTSPQARIAEFGRLYPTAVSQAHHGIHPRGFTDAYAKDGGSKAHLFWMLAYNNCQTNFSTTQTGDVLYNFTVHPQPPQTGLPPVARGAEKKTADGTLPFSAEWIGFAPTAAELLCIKPAENGKGLILRFINPTETPQPLNITLPAAYTQAWRCDACEHKQEKLCLTGGRLERSLSAHGLLTLRLEEGG